MLETKSNETLIVLQTKCVNNVCNLHLTDLVSSNNEQLLETDKKNF